MVSTVLLSTVVVARGRLVPPAAGAAGPARPPRRRRSLREVGTENQAAERAPRGRARHRHRRRRPGQRRAQLDLHQRPGPWLQRGAWPGRARRTPPWPSAAPARRPSSTSASVPQSLVDHFDDDRLTARRVDLHHDRSSAADGKVTQLDPGHRRRLDRCTIPADGSTRTVYYLFPLDDVQQTLALVDPRPADRRRPAARC